jgi:hypothetical protein
MRPVVAYERCLMRSELLGRLDVDEIPRFAARAQGQVAGDELLRGRIVGLARKNLTRVRVFWATRQLASKDRCGSQCATAGCSSAHC